MTLHTSFQWRNSDKQGDYAASTPCKHVDLPQTQLEPILVKHARDHGFTIRWNTTFLHFDRPTPDSIVSTLRDDVTGLEYSVKSKYLFGCDGGRSPIMRQLEISFYKGPGEGMAFNVFVNMDLDKYDTPRPGTLNWIFRPDIDRPAETYFCVIRIVEPWHK